MPFIPGKLKPRIKPRLGARVVGTVESSDPLKNKPEDQSPFVEALVQPKDPAPSSISETETQQEHLPQTAPSDETKSDTKCSAPIRNKAPDPILSIFGDLTKNSDLAKSLARADGDSKNVIDENVVHHSLSIKTDAERSSSGFAENKSLEPSKEEVHTEIVSDDGLVKGNSCDADKKPTKPPIPADASSDDDGQTSSTIPSIKEPIRKSNLKNTRPISLNFPKPNLNNLARPLIANSSDKVEQAADSDATPKAIDVPIPTKTGDQELSCVVSSPALPGATKSFAEPLSHAANPLRGAGSETSAEVSINSSTDRVISYDASEKFISIDQSLSTSVVSKDSSVESMSATSQIMGDVQRHYSNSGSDKTKKTDPSDRSVFKKPPKIFKRAPILKSDRVRTRPDTPKTMLPSSTDDSKSMDIVDVATTQENADAENVTSASIPMIDTTIDRHLISTSPLSDVNDNTKNAPSKDSEKMELSGSDPQVPLKPTDAPKTTPVSKIGKSTKGEAEDVKALFAISAVDYLKRHDHALGDSILRRLIIGDKNMENRSRKATMCSTCNPQTLKKCLSSLWSFDKFELQTIIKKATERQKAPSVSHASLPGKTLFKPSLGR